jgi:hypothetical protein
MIDQLTLKKYTNTASCRTNTLDDLFNLGSFTRGHWHMNRVDDDHAIFRWIDNTESTVVKPGDWTYYINRYNFRDPWLLDSPKLKVGFFGCSFTFGMGIKSEDTFVQIAANECNLQPFNFGIGGSSIHRSAKIFSTVTNLINLDYAVFTLPPWHRQLHIDQTGHTINMIPGLSHVNYRNLNKKLVEIDEEYHMVQAISFITWIYDIAKLKNIKLILSSWDSCVNSLCQVMYPQNTIDKFPTIDAKASRDQSHPGPTSQAAHATQIIQKINNNTWS